MIRIRGEIPQFKRCCMCLPLRHGLIVWGYIRLVIGVIILVGFTKDFFQMLGISKNEAGYEVYVVRIGFFVILGGADIVLNVVFVYAGHTKNQKMMKAYYIYSFVLWILIIILGVYISAHAVYVMTFFRVWIIIFDVVIFLAHIVIQAYVLLLVRSEFMKLTRDYEFRFVNNAAESACKINCEEHNLSNRDIRAHTDIVADGNIRVNRDVIADTDTIADGDMTANRNVIANGFKGVNKNGTNKSVDTMTY